MNMKVAAGFLAGITAAAAIPVFAQTGTTSSGAASAVPRDEMRMRFEMRGPISQEDLQTMIDREKLLLANIDEMVAIHKDAMQDHIAALTAAASITDDARRQEAVHAAHEAMRTTIQEAVKADPDLRGMGFMHVMKHGKGRHGMFMKK